MYKLYTKYTLYTKPSNVEGSCSIRQIEPLQINRGKLIMSYILTICTLGVFQIWIRWHGHIKRYFYYRFVEIHKAQYVFIKNYDKSREIKKVLHRTNERGEEELYFINRFITYVYIPQENKFQAVEHSVQQLTCQEIKQQQGLQGDAVKKAQETFGKCQIYFHIPGFFEFMFKSLTSPVNFFVYLGILLWFVEGLVLFAVMMLITTIVTSAILYVFVRISRSKLRSFAKVDVKVRVVRNGSVSQISSTELVPGDVFFIEKNTTLPCDCVLIEGETLMDENTLTGEVIPVPKFEIESSQQKFDYNVYQMNFLFEGTKVLNVNPIQQGGEVKGYVVRTGFMSFRVRIRTRSHRSHTQPSNFRRPSQRRIARWSHPT